MPRFSVILVEPKYQGNIGAVARVMKNFDFKNLILINPPDISGEARAMAMHAQDILKNAKILNSFEEIKERFDFLVGTTAISATDKNYLRNPVFPEDLVNSMDTDGRIALIFGREDCGLLNDELKECDLLVTIPASREYPTLNIANSVAIILYEISRLEMKYKLRGLKKFRKINSLEKKVLLEKFDNLVDLLYRHNFDRRLIKKTFRQIIGRAFISGRESFNLTGLFRKAYDRIKKD